MCRRKYKAFGLCENSRHQCADLCQHQVLCQYRKRKCHKQKLHHVTEDIENECYAGKESLESVLDKTEHDVFELLSTRQTGDYVPIRTVVMNALEKIEKAAQPGGAQ